MDNVTKKILTVFFLIFLTTSVSAWWDSDWSNKQRLTLSTSSLSNDVTSDQPIMVKIDSTDTDFWNNVLSDGRDVRFIAADDLTELVYHFEKFDSVGDEMIAWVKVTDTFSSSSDMNIFMYYNNPTAVDNQNESGTYTSSYQQVYHLGEASGTLFDSTSNDRNSTAQQLTAYQAAGKIGDAADFEYGVVDYIDVPKWSFGNSDITFMAWVKHESLVSGQTIVGNWGSGAEQTGKRNWLLVFGATPGRFSANIYDGGGSVARAETDLNTFPISTGVWYHLIGTWDDASNTVKIYVDGVQRDDSNAVNISMANSTHTSSIGSQEQTIEPMDGIIDEIKILNTDLSADEAKLLYESESDQLITFELISGGSSSSSSDQNIWLTFVSDDGNVSADNNADTLTVTGGTGVDSSIAGDVLTLIFDATEVLTTTWGNGSLFTWTFDASAGTDTSMAFGDNSIDITSETLTTSGNFSLEGNNKELRFYEAANYVGFEAPALTSNQIWVLPDSDGASDQVLSTDGSGNLSWADSSSGGVTKIFGGYGIDVNANTGDVNITANTNEVFTTVAVTNRTGSTVSKGDVVVIDSGNANSVKFAANNPDTRRVLGVVRLGGLNLQTIYVQTTGRATVNASGSIDVGDIVVSTNDNDGKARTDNTPGRAKLGRALTSGTDTTVDIVIQT